MLNRLFKKKPRTATEIHRTSKGHHIDPDMNYCPLCDDEYRGELAKCGVCGSDLVSGVEKIEQIQSKAKRKNSSFHSDQLQDSPVTLYKGGLLEVKSVQQILNEHGIESRMVKNDDSCHKSCCGVEMVLEVQEGDLAESAAVLADYFKRTTGLDQNGLLSETDPSDHSDGQYGQNVENSCPGCQNVLGATSMECPECGLRFG